MKPSTKALAAAIAALAFPACGRMAPAQGPVLLVSIDTLSADRVGAWGCPEARTPVLDRIARRGLQVEDAISPAPLTLPSHATMLTGVDPPAHGLRDNGLFRLGEEPPTVAGLLPEDIATAGFVGGFPLLRTFGLGRDFDVWDDVGLGAPEPGRHPQRRADQVLAAAREWLEHRRGEDRPFAFVHLYDPHFPYEAPAPWPRAMKGTDATRAYDAEVAFVDRSLRVFLAALDTLRADPPTLVLTADHGESLGRHGEPTHANFVYDATQRVPLAVCGAGIEPRLESAPRRLADVAATLLDIYGEGDEGSGSSLLEPAPAETAYLETMHTKLFKGWSPLHGARTERWKYVRAPRPELYDLEQDPGELHNRHDELPEVVDGLAAFVDSALADEADQAPAGLTEEVRERLAGLGYAGGAMAPDGLAEPDRDAKDPKDGIVSTAALFHGQQAFLRGDLVEAEEQLEAAVRADPLLKDAYAYLAGTYLRTREYREAIAAGEQALRLEPHVNEGPILMALADASRALGRGADAARYLARSRAATAGRDPRAPGHLRG